MTKPAGQLDFDLTNPMLTNFFCGTTLSEYAGSTFKVETKTGDVVGNIINPLWSADKGIESVKGVDMQATYPYEFVPYFDPFTVIVVFTLTGAPVRYSGLYRTDCVVNEIERFLDMEDSYTELRALNDSQSGQDVSAIGSETVAVIKYGIDFNVRSGSGGGATFFTSIIGSAVTEHRLGFAPGFITFNPNAIIMMQLIIEEELSDVQVDSVIADPWQLTKTRSGGLIVPPNPLLLGQDF